ncbi:MAG: 4Fe-4S binding protein [Synergistaceae bacterium]|nr:4Fe-4S binding protein [Synergistaceae bacterium]
MKVRNIRSVTQHLGFLILMYGGRFGVRLGSALPCFACPFVPGCGGYCYLMGLQGYIGFGMGALTGVGLMTALSWFALFVFLVAMLGKLWCGWICPFGLVQDWLSALRGKLGVRERQITQRMKRRMAMVKYGLLAYIAILPPLATLGFLHEDFYLPFCDICPGKSLLPLFAGETRYLALNFDNGVSLGFSIALLVITGIMLVGMFFKDRFFCIFCPLLALIHILKPLTALRLFKLPEACTGCGTCRRVCPMDIEDVYRQRTSPDVQTDECLDCAKCAESCPADGAIGLKFLKFKLFLSSRSYAADSRKKS